MKKFLVIVLLFLVIDSVWLSTIAPYMKNTVKTIQGGRPMKMRYFPIIFIYLAMAWLLTLAKNAKEALLIGFTSYLIFDFTVLALFKDYPLWLAISDAIWGGFLFAVVFIIIENLNLK